MHLARPTWSEQGSTQFERQEWSEQASCAGQPTKVFVPSIDTLRIRREHVQKPPQVVTTLCSVCSVREKCHRYGVATQSTGWWGGVLLYEGEEVSDTGHVKGPLNNPTPAEQQRRFLAEALFKDTEECIDWPYAVNNQGRPRITLDGSRQVVAGVVCTAAYGPRPSREYSAQLSCGNPLCINRRHLSWRKFPWPATKLSDDQVREIRSLYQPPGTVQRVRSHQALAERFDVEQTTIGRILRGEQRPNVV